MKIDYAPLLPDGFKAIGLWQLDDYFLAPFLPYEQERRTHLVNQLRRFLEELHKLSIPLEIWIDGSFTTRKTEPDDVDLVVWVAETDAESLSPERSLIFDSLLHKRNHGRVKVTYDIDAHLANPASALQRAEYIELFGKDRSNLADKGIFTITISHV